MYTLILTNQIFTRLRQSKTGCSVQPSWVELFRTTNDKEVNKEYIVYNIEYHYSIRITLQHAEFKTEQSENVNVVRTKRVLFVCVDVLHPTQHFCRHDKRFPVLYPYSSAEDSVLLKDTYNTVLL